MPRLTATHRSVSRRSRRFAPQRASLFDQPSRPAETSQFDVDSPADDPSLLEDLVALVALGLLEERATPEGTVFALTELGLHTPTVDGDE